MLNKKLNQAFMLHKKGFNCAQSVVLPFTEELGIDKATAMRSLEGFGAGMGGFELTCGALSGAVYAAGLINSDGNLDKPMSKKQTYTVCKELTQKFIKECGSSCCSTLKGIHTKVPLKSCNDCIAVGVRLVFDMLKS